MDINLHTLLYEEDSFGIFILVTIVLGGGAAWLSGRAIAGTWRPWWHVPIYMLILGVAVRFIHFALFEGTFISPHFYLTDTAILMAFGFLAFRVTRVRQMITQYRWINIRNGPFAWARRPPEAA